MMVPPDLPIITLDVDWAPDFVIDAVADILIAARVKATWFVTHASDAVDRLRAFPELFELGIHPNFLPGSTHGDSHDQVLRHCLKLVPGATSMRTHSLYQSSPLLHKIATQTSVTTDVSLFLPRAGDLRPLHYSIGGGRFCRIPYMWEDDVEMEQHPQDWSVKNIVGAGGGLKVMGFHPIHVYLNSVNLEAYRRLKERSGPLARLRQETVSKYRFDGTGTASMFREAVEYLSDRPSLRICDLVERAGTGDSMQGRAA